MNQTNTYLLQIIYIPLILFLIGSLIYDHHQRGYLFTSRSLNEAILIEQALEHIPTCNSHDRPRQRSLLYTLHAWTRLARLHNIRYWIAYKTLANYLQHFNLSPSDQDIDILIMAEDTPQIIKLQKANYSSIYELKVHPQWFITKVSNRSYFPFEEINFIIENSRFINRKNNVSINIWPMYANYSNKNILMLVQYLDFNNRMLSPIEWTFPLEPCVMSNIRVWCPAQPKKLTASIYEQKSVYLSCINGSWINSNE